MSVKRETFTSNFGLLMSMIGVAVGLGNVWRFPYMVGKYGGGAFVFLYLIAVFLVGIPALMAEWTLGRHTQRGPAGAFEKAGLPGGKFVGFFFFLVVACATGYYSVTLGWVGYYALSDTLQFFGASFNPESIFPPQNGFNEESFLLQMMMTFLVILSCGVVLIKGLRKGIQKVSQFIMPVFLSILFFLIVRSLLLEGAGKGLTWYIGRFDFKALHGSVVAAALGQAVFSLSLGGTFMVIYGSYLHKNSSIPKNALFTGLGDAVVGLVSGLAIFPAVFSFGLEPSSGPDLIFSTLPRVFSMLPMGTLFGLIFFVGLFGVAYLSAVAAFEVMVGGIVDNSQFTRKQAVLLISTGVFLLAIPPMLNFSIFVSWDLTFGSGMQTLGSLIAVFTVFWCMKRADALKELTSGAEFFPKILYWWMKIVVPTAVFFVGLNWLLESVFHWSLL